jgi:hypothetical protein
MNHRSRVPIGVLLIGALLQVAGSVQAAPVAVNNPSFETPVLENNVAEPLATGWTYWTSDGGLNAGGAVTANPTGYDGADGDTAYGFIGASGNGTPVGADGPNVFWEYINPSQYSLLQQVLDVTVQAGGTYTFTVAVGKVPTGGNAGAQLLISTEGAPGTFPGLLGVATLTPAEMTSAEFVDLSCTFTPTAEQVVSLGGQRLMISLCGYSNGDYERVAFDNVRGETSGLAVPEPGALVLLASGLLGLLTYAWRRRK